MYLLLTYGNVVPHVVRHVMYFFALYSFVGFIMDGPGAVLVGALGLELVPTFDQPWMVGYGEGTGREGWDGFRWMWMTTWPHAAGAHVWPAVGGGLRGGEGAVAVGWCQQRTTLTSMGAGPCPSPVPSLHTACKCLLSSSAAVTLAPQSDCLADFWARRWNITTSSVLRTSVYDIVMDGCLVNPRYGKAGGTAVGSAAAAAGGKGVAGAGGVANGITAGEGDEHRRATYLPAWPTFHTKHCIHVSLLPCHLMTCRRECRDVVPCGTLQWRYSSLSQLAHPLLSSPCNPTGDLPQRRTPPPHTPPRRPRRPRRRLPRSQRPSAPAPPPAPARHLPTPHGGGARHLPRERPCA